MDLEGPSTATQFSQDDLIWAKMKGFPPWPAKVLPNSEDTPAGRLRVFFFGTKETAFMKISDVSDYTSNKHQYEVPRKHKGFNEAVHEVRVAAGIESPTYRDPLFFGGTESTESPSPPEDRRSSAKPASDSFLNSFIGRRSPSATASTKSRSRASSSSASAMKLLRKLRRKRLDSESSNGSRRNKMISGFNDKFSGTMFSHMEMEGNDFPGLDESPADDARSTKSRRSRNSSKVFEDYIFGHRNRSGSTSEGGRQRNRLISGVSDVFEELLAGSDLTLGIHAENLLNTLDEMPSESSELPFFDRPGTPETLAPLPGPSVFCNNCGSECKRRGQRWRCTAKHCMKYNDPDPTNIPSTSNANNLHIISSEDTKPTRIVEQKQFLGSPSPVRSPTRRSQRIEPQAKIKKKDKENLQEPSSAEQDNEKVTKEKDSKPLAKKKKVQVVEPHRISLTPSSPQSSPAKIETNPLPVKRANGRPQKYKVEKTPPIGPDGLRQCTFCSGQVRPQMCGGNKHRWRCVDKKCRKWYGWVRSSDEIPRDLGRKGRFNSVIQKIKLKKKGTVKKDKEAEKRQGTGGSTVPVIQEYMREPESISSAGEAATAAAALEMSSRRSDATGRSSPVAKMLVTLANKQGPDSQAKRKGRPPKGSAKIKLKTKERAEEDSKLSNKRKGSKKNAAEDFPKRPLSPLTAREMRYRPCAMEKRARWWISEKRRAEASPERDFSTTAMDSAAAFRIVSNAFRSAAVTRADEIGTVNGSLDLLMDTLMGSMAPLLSLLGRLPNMRPEQEVLQRLWDSSAVHLPTFQ